MEKPVVEGVDEPIVRRLEKLKQQYREFIGSSAARVLHWRLRDDELGMLQAFVEHDARAAESGDSLLTVPSPYGLRFEHGIVLVHDLDEVLEAAAAALGDAGPPSPVWIPPDPPRTLERRPGAAAPDQEYLVRALASLYEHLQPQVKHLCLILQPREVSNAADWAAWLDELVPLLNDDRVRLIVPDHAPAPLHAGLVRHGSRVVSVEPNLDMPAAYEEIASATPDRDRPEGRFRLQFVKIGNALGKNDLARARAEAPAALAIAQSQNWPYLEFAVHQQLGSGELGLGQPQAAMGTFAKAAEAAQRALGAGTDWAAPLLLQARLGMGAAAVASGAFPLGGRIYAEQALPVAQQMSDARMQIECLRMAAYCEEQSGAFDAAWAHLTQAVGIAREMPEAERQATTIGFAGQALLRITAMAPRYRDYGPGVEQEMQRLLGPDWKERLGPQPVPEGGEAPSPLENAAPPAGSPEGSAR